MTAMNDTDRITLMAYVDGELAAGEHAQFEARLATDSELTRAVTRERALRVSLRASYGAILDEPIPDRLADLLRMHVDGEAPPTKAANDAWRPDSQSPQRTTPTASGRRGSMSRGWQWPEWGAMAACVLAGVLLGARAFAPARPIEGSAASGQVALAEDAHGVLTAQGSLRAALEQRTGADDRAGPAASGAGAANVRIGLTFRNHAQEYCRTFALGASSGIACKQDGRWAVADLERSFATPVSPAAAGSSTLPPNDGYRTAASPLSATLLQAVDALRDGDTLDAAGEAAARAAGWQR